MGRERGREGERGRGGEGERGRGGEGERGRGGEGEKLKKKAEKITQTHQTIKKKGGKEEVRRIDSKHQPKTSATQR